MTAKSESRNDVRILIGLRFNQFWTVGFGDQGCKLVKIYDTMTLNEALYNIISLSKIYSSPCKIVFSEGLNLRL